MEEYIGQVALALFQGLAFIWRDLKIGNKLVEKTIEKIIANSLCFSLIKADEQIGFARVLTDGVIYAVILDMFIHEDFRGQGLGKWLVRCIGEHPDIISLRLVLWTRAASDFYKKIGFEEVSKLKFMAQNWKM